MDVRGLHLALQFQTKLKWMPCLLLSLLHLITEEEWDVLGASLRHYPHSFRVYTRNKILPLVVFGELSESIQLPSGTARDG